MMFRLHAHNGVMHLTFNCETQDKLFEILSSLLRGEWREIEVEILEPS